MTVKEKIMALEFTHEKIGNKKHIIELCNYEHVFYVNDHIKKDAVVKGIPIKVIKLNELRKLIKEKGIDVLKTVKL